jgi:Cft2 family RNA processing exonuclease
MRIINLNPDHDIGASAWFLSIDDHNLLMDAGVHPKREGRDSLPLFDVIKNETLDSIAITHCHHDHVGGLPVALQYFPRTHVMMPDLSYFLVERVLHNSVNVMIRQRDELGVQDYPLFTHNEVDDIAHLFTGYRYNREIEFGSDEKHRKGIVSPTLEFFDAGHALGSSGVLVRGKKETMFYTGDVCFQDQTILKAARFEGVKADVLIMETTRGNRETPKGFTREAEADRLGLAIQRVLSRGGSVLLPVFALGRTQEILTELLLLMREGKLARQPIYIGGLGRVFTEIYDLEAERTYRKFPNLRMTEDLNLQVLEPGQVEKMRLTPGRIFVVTAGMMSEKTAAHDLAVRIVGDPQHGIFFVGYADPETPGGRLKAAKDGETFFFSTSGGELTRRCEIQDFDLTAHASREHLLDFVGQVEPKTVILGHGDGPSRAWFEQQIKAKYPGIAVHQLAPGATVQT